jgi:hypothetical protein
MKIYDPLTGMEITPDEFRREIAMLRRKADDARDERIEEMYLQVIGKRQQQLAAIGTHSVALEAS